MKSMRQFGFHSIIADIESQALITDADSLDPVDAAELAFGESLRGFQIRRTGLNLLRHVTNIG